MNKYVIGIDLGTTYSCVAVLQNGKVEVIPNEQGNRTTPSYVAFNETERHVGESALNQAALNPINTVFEAKRLIGKQFSDVTVQESIKRWPFRVTDFNQKALIQVEYKHRAKTFYPEEISSMVLSSMKDIAESYLGVEVFDAVIAVPAYFSDAQRQATRDAGTIAGLHVMRIINEPTAAAIAYGLEKCAREREYILVFDMGGGTFDVSILAVENGNFHVLATSGDAHLGGEDFDARLVQHCVKTFQRRHQTDIGTNARCLRRLKTACEKAKRLLSTATQASIQIESLMDGIDFNATISRALFENICSDLFKKSLVLVQEALADSKLKKSEIDTIVLVGGSTRIPKIQNLLKDFFDQKELNKSIHPDEAVAIGAAAHGATFSCVGNAPVTIENMTLHDVIPHSVGVKVEDGVMDVLLPRNSLKPSAVTRSYTTCYDKQQIVKIEVYEGEDTLTGNNTLLAQFQLRDIPAMSAGLAEIKVTFEVDSDGILNVTAVEESKGITKRMTVKNRDRFSASEIDRMSEQADAMKAEDQRIREKISLKNSLEETIYRVQDLLDDGMIAKHHRFKASQLVNNSKKWLTDNDRSASVRELEHHNKTMDLLEKEILSGKEHKKVDSIQLEAGDIKEKKQERTEQGTKKVRKLKKYMIPSTKAMFKEGYARVGRLETITEADESEYSELGRNTQENKTYHLEKLEEELPSQSNLEEDKDQHNSVDGTKNGELESKTKHTENQLSKLKEHNAKEEDAESKNQSDDGITSSNPLHQYKTELIRFANEFQTEVNSVHLSYETRKTINTVIQQALTWLHTTHSTSTSELNYFERTLETHRNMMCEELKNNKNEIKRKPTDALPTEIYQEPRDKLPVTEEPIYDEIKPLQNEDLDNFQQHLYNVPNSLPSLTDNQTSSVTLEKQLDIEENLEHGKHDSANELTEEAECFYQNIHENRRNINEVEEETSARDLEVRRYNDISKSYGNTQDRITESCCSRGSHDVHPEDHEHNNDKENETSIIIEEKLVKQLLSEVHGKAIHEDDNV